MKVIIKFFIQCIFPDSIISNALHVYTATVINSVIFLLSLFITKLTQPVEYNQCCIAVHSAIGFQFIRNLIEIRIFVFAVKQPPLENRIHSLLDVEFMISRLIHHRHDALQRPYALHTGVIYIPADKRHLQVLHALID